MKNRLRVAGAVVSAAALAFFTIHALHGLRDQDLSSLWTPRAAAATGLIILFYCALIPITAMAWHWLAQGLGARLSFASAAPVLAVTQIGKYIPGNIAQHLGRLALARRHGMSDAANILSLAYETLLVLLASAHVGALMFLWQPPVQLLRQSGLNHRYSWLLLFTLLAFSALLAVPRLALWLARRRNGAPRWLPARFPPWRSILGAYLLYALNFTVIGTALWVSAGLLGQAGSTLAQLPLFISAFAGSWILGFMAPGAPAGLGVREAVLSVWLGSTLDPVTTFSLIVMLRVSTTAGDLISFCWGNWALSRIGHAHSGHLPPTPEHKE